MDRKIGIEISLKLLHRRHIVGIVLNTALQQKMAMSTRKAKTVFTTDNRTGSHVFQAWVQITTQPRNALNFGYFFI